MRHRTFRLFWGAGAASDIGTWVQLAAIGSLVAASSGSALSTAMVAAATFAPQGICSPIGGLLADRFERRRVFLITLGAQAVVTTVIAFVVGGGLRDPAVLSLLVLFQSSAGALGAPSLQAILPDLVPADELTAAVALGITSWNSGRVVGPLLATALVPFGAQWAIAANAVSFYVLWFAIRQSRSRFRPATRVWQSARRELVAGIDALRRSRGCVTAVITVITLHLVVVPFMGLIPSTSRALLLSHGGAVTDASVTSIAARLMSAQGVGAIAGSLLVANLVRRLDRSTIVTALLAVLAVLAPLHEYAPSWIVTALLVFVMGSCVAVVQSVFGGVVQRDASPEHRGRILSWYQGMNGLAYGIGLLGLGAASDRYGLRTVFVGSGIALVVLILACRRSLTWASAVDDTDADIPEPIIAAALS
ncbi:MAG: arabinose efflux permease family protein [Ilumatobacteraceae bacterium]|nr:arabinose efflux permease family protein [Ilumatobacteraceae bacterium]